MAFTEAERIKIRVYLGWPVFAEYNGTLESAIERAEQLPEREEAVREQLGKLAAIETELGGLPSVAIASQVGAAKLNPRRSEDLAALGRREVLVLATMLEVTVVRDVFAVQVGGGGWRGGPLGWA